MVVALDGPGGVGKSTVARAVASALGLPHLDTGSYYRAVTLAVLEAGVEPTDDEAVTTVAAAAVLDYVDGEMQLDGRGVGDAVRSAEVTAAVSVVSAIPEVRRVVVDRQRSWVAGRGGAAVVEGRDIGTVVFPDAVVKVFLTADADVRAARRSGDAEADGMDVAAIADALRARDRLDSTRPVSPLVPAHDAVTVDTTHLDVDEVAAIVLSLAAIAADESDAE